MGILFHGSIGLLHEGHRDEGKTIDLPLGILYIQTFRKEPTREPNKNTMAYKNILLIEKNRGQSFFILQAYQPHGHCFSVLLSAS